MVSQKSNEGTVSWHETQMREKNMDNKEPTKAPTLPDSETLPSAQALGKGPSNTWQRLCRVPIRQRSLGKELIGKGILCRVPRVRHSAKALPRAMSALGKG